MKQNIIIIVLLIVICCLGIEVYHSSTKEEKEVVVVDDSEKSLEEENVESDLYQKIYEDYSEYILNLPDESKDGLKSTQLSGTYYDIDYILKEERDISNIKNYKEFEFDLDGDEVTDTVTLRHIVNEEEEYYSSERDYHVLEYNGETIYEHWEGMGTVGIVDLDSTDNLLEIFVYDDGPSDDPTYYFYRKVGNKIVELGSFNVEGGFYTDGKGKIITGGRNLPWVYPRVYDCYYTIVNNRFRENILDFSYNADFEYCSLDGLFTEDLSNVSDFLSDVVYGEGILIDNFMEEAPKYNIKQLDSDTRFKIVELIKGENEWDVMDLKVVLSDGTEGYLIHPYSRIYFYD